jgi:hypothetical protein
MGFKLDNFGTEVANAKGTLGGICYYRYRNSEGDDLTTPGYFPALLGLNVGDRIFVIPQDASNADDLYVVTSIANRTVEVEKVSSGGGGGGVIEPLVVTPSTTAQTIEAPEGVDGFSPVNIDPVEATIDTNIVAENIKDGVEILGVTGSYTGEAPSGTISITSNGTHNVSGYASASVAVPTSAPALYRSFVKEGGQLVASTTESSIINLTGITYLTNYVLYGAYAENTVISGAVDMSDVENIANYATGYAFSGCTGITSLDLSSLIRYDSGGTNAFINSGLTTVSMSSVEYMNEAYYMFAGTQLTTISLPKCYFLESSGYMFENVSTLTSADLSAVVYFEYDEYMFTGCSSLVSVDLSSAAYIHAPGLFQDTALTTVSFPSFAPDTQWYDEHNDALVQAFNNVSNITLHFPSNVQSIVEGLDEYSATAPFGATAGSVLFDLPATYAIEDQNGSVLVRCPVKDTASALAWFMWSQQALLWTAGTTQPSINDVLYANPDLTNPSDLVVNSIIQ